MADLKVAENTQLLVQFRDNILQASCQGGTGRQGGGRRPAGVGWLERRLCLTALQPRSPPCLPHRDVTGLARPVGCVWFWPGLHHASTLPACLTD